MIKLFGFLVGFCSYLWLLGFWFFNLGLITCPDDVNVAEAVHSEFISWRFLGNADNIAAGILHSFRNVLLFRYLIMYVALSLLGVISPRWNTLARLLVG